MFKKLKDKFNSFWYRYHRKKMYKYLMKSIGSKRYIKDYLMADKKTLDEVRMSFNSGNTYASYDVVSAYPSWMVQGKYPLVNQGGDENE